MTNGVSIIYGNIAVGAREQLNATTADKEAFVDLSQLKQDIAFPNYSNPCELYNTVLDGSFLPVPTDPTLANMGLWSMQVSGENGQFETPIVLVLETQSLFSSDGITLYFDTINGVYSNNVRMRWFRDDNVISEKNFTPNSAEYFFENRVEFYNRIEVTFYSINMGYNRLRVHSVIYGGGIEFKRNQLESVKLIQEIDPLSTQIPINTCDFNVRSTNNAVYSFSERQSIKVYFNGDLKSTNFIKSFKRKSQNQWQVKTEDYKGILQSTPFSGGIYEGAKAVDLLNQISATAKVPFAVDEALNSETVWGYIPYTNCREALMQVAFAIGAVVDTCGREDVRIYQLSDNVSRTVPLDRIMQGQESKDEARLTAFELTAHEYVKSEELLELYKHEGQEKQGILIKFSEPVYELSITSGGEVVESGATYAVINAQPDCVLSGKKYKHIETVVAKENPLVLATDSQNVIAVEKATLISKHNVDEIVEKCYNYFVNQTEFTSKIIEGKHLTKMGNVKYGEKKYGEFKYGYESGLVYDTPVNVGDYIGLETQYLGMIYGRVVRQSYNLNGGIIIKDTVVR